MTRIYYQDEINYKRNILMASPNISVPYNEAVLTQKWSLSVVLLYTHKRSFSYLSQFCLSIFCYFLYFLFIEPVQPKVPRNLTASVTDSSITLYWIPPEQDIRELTGYVLGFGRFIPEVFRESVSRDKTSFIFNNLGTYSPFIRKFC